MIKLTNVMPNDNIMVALSGGSDSTCLLHLLYSQKDKLNITLSAVNVDHSIRGEESKQDSLFVKNYCEKLGIPLKSYVVDAVKFSSENGYSLEQGARILRYQIFEKLLQEDNSLKIATAHHKEDSVETTLFNLFRGTGLKGLSGIQQTSKIIRPLLNADKSEILDYLKENDIPFCTDSTNSDEKYSRNYIRQKVLPLISKKFPESINNIYNFSQTAKEEDDYLDMLACKIISRVDNKIAISLNNDKVLLKRAIILALKECGVEKDYTKKHIDSAYELINLPSGSSVDLKNGVKVVNEYDKITFYTDMPKKDDSEYLFSLGTFSFENSKVVIERCNSDNLKEQTLFDLDKIPKNAVIRMRKEGDVFTKCGGTSKKLKDYFIDKKIERYKRDNIPLIALGSKVLVIIGVAVSEMVKVDNSTKNIIKASIRS